MAELGASLVVGLNSGTSMDGVDALLVEISEDTNSQLFFRQLHYLTYPYPNGLKEDLLKLSRTDEGRIQDVCAYNVLLGRIFADAAKAVVEAAGRGMGEVALVGSHGQTVHHLPTHCHLHGYDICSTLQIGDPTVIANQCGVTTVGDFRMADVSVLGQGAPIVPYLDGILLHRHFQTTGRVGVVLNIGGISNISAILLDDNGGYSNTGFDCGPGNVLVDALAKKWYGEDYDKDGRRANSGHSSSVLLDTILAEDIFVPCPLPKSTGREYYSSKYLDDVLDKAEKLKLSKEDTLATITEFTAAAVSLHYDRHVRPHFAGKGYELDLFVCGGGAKNNFMMSCLRKKLQGVKVSTSSELGVDPDAREALLFAVLAYQTYKWRPTAVPEVTGAQRQVIQGKICPVLRS